ncbi:MAG: DNA glycosylase [Nitrososphaera sp.]|jgi:A/G-specific adenine glycosylase
MLLQLTGRNCGKNSFEMNSEVTSSKIEIHFFRNTLLEWFKKNGRKYPWRNEKDPYRVLVAEMMLQRTRVEQVLPVYNEFIKKFPNVRTLADAKIEDIAVFVAKLGLFWRSKIMKETARSILIEHRGTIPSERKALLKIPGIGDYIADAMISFAFNGKRSVIDSNVIRLTTRFFGIESKGEMRRNSNFIYFCQGLSRDLQPEGIRNLNYALIDHSAAVCKPVPLCDQCPLSKNCHYFKGRRLIDK